MKISTAATKLGRHYKPKRNGLLISHTVRKSVQQLTSWVFVSSNERWVYANKRLKLTQLPIALWSFFCVFVGWIRVHVFSVKAVYNLKETIKLISEFFLPFVFVYVQTQLLKRWPTSPWHNANWEPLLSST